MDILNADLESPFEEEVYQALSDNFDENKLIPQYQFGGFRIDIVYDSKQKGIPKIAIECDGASYHSSQEAYLYDKHRQKILESNGFIFHRIWSTNWWRNSKRETNKLVKSIKEVENSKPKRFKDYSKTGLAFTDDIYYHNIKPSAKAQEEDKEKIKSFQNDVDIERKSFIQKEIDFSTNETDSKIADKSSEFVKLNSKVKIKYLNNNNIITVQIVEIQVESKNIINGVHLINQKSPLAMKITDKKVGEILKFGALDNYIEIMDVINE